MSSSSTLANVLVPRSKSLSSAKTSLEEAYSNPKKQKQLLSKLTVVQYASYALLKEHWLAENSALPKLAPTIENVLNGLHKAELAKRSNKKLPKIRDKAAVIAARRRIAFAIGKHDLCLPSFPDCEIKPPFNATLDPGWWFIVPDGEAGLPYYLWDTVEKKTVRRSDIPTANGVALEYTVISHAWGNHISTMHPWVQIPDVPWKLPYLKKFEISKLPDKLSKLSSRYVWIDLLTIPQGPETIEYKKRQATEIQKQPAIFRGAKEAVVWFSDIEKWEVLPDVIRYLGLDMLAREYALSPGDKAKVEEHMATLGPLLHGIPEVVAWQDPKGDAGPGRWDMYYDQPNDWFSSEWTIQEACIRPDMLIASADFQFLAVAGSSRVKINDIVALLQDYTGRGSPNAVLRLRSMLLRSGHCPCLTTSESLMIKLDAGTETNTPKLQIRDKEKLNPSILSQVISSNKAKADLDGVSRQQKSASPPLGSESSYHTIYD